MDEHYNVFDVSALRKPRVKDYNSAGQSQQTLREFVRLNIWRSGG